MATKRSFVVLLLLSILILVSGVILAAFAAPTPTPTATPAGERCLRAGDLCLPVTNVSINTILDTASSAVGSWQAASGTASQDWWEGASYKILDDYGITREQFDEANASKSIKPQSLLLMVMPFVLIFFLIFCILDVKNPLTIFREGSAEWGFMESVKERIAPGWPLTELLETEYAKGFHKRIIAGLDTPMYGRILGEIGKKSVAGMGSDEAAGAMRSLGEINGKLKGQAKNVIRGILMDVATVLTAAEYAIPMLIVFVVAYLTISSVLPAFEATKDWVPLLTIVYELLAITFWAFWLWESMRFMLVRSGFLLAMIFPVSVLKFLYIPFTGGGIRIVARAFQTMGMMMVIATLRPAATTTDPLGLALGMTASMTLYILLVVLVLAQGMLVSLVAESLASPFVAIVGFLRGLSAAAAKPAMPKAPELKAPGLGPATMMDFEVFNADPTKNRLGQNVMISKMSDGKFRATGPGGTEYALWNSVENVKTWAENFGVNLGNFLERPPPGTAIISKGKGPKT